MFFFFLLKAAFVRKSYCSVGVSSVYDLSSERAKVKVYVVNSFVERRGYLPNEDSPQPSTFKFYPEFNKQS